MKITKTILMIFSLLLFASCSNFDLRLGKSSSYIRTDDYIRVWQLKMAKDSLKVGRYKDGEQKQLKDKIAKREKQKAELTILLNDIKEAIYYGENYKFDSYMKKGIINNFRLSKIKKMNLTGLKVYYGKKKFYKNSMKTVMLLAFNEETFYMDVRFILTKEGWKIDKISEKSA